MARTARRSRTRRSPTTRRSRSALPLPRMRLGLSQAVVRSLVGIVMLVLGAMLLIALALPGQGQLTDWVRNAIVPFFGAGRWLLPFVLLLAGAFIERVLVRGQAGPGLLPVPAAYVLLFAVLLAGLAIAFDVPLRQLLGPLTASGKAVTTAFTDARAAAKDRPPAPAVGRPRDEDERKPRTARGVR